MIKHVPVPSSLLPLRVPLLGLGVAIALAGCAMSERPMRTDPGLMQEALAGAGAPLPGTDTRPPASAAVPTASTRAIRQGNQHFVRPARARTPVQDSERGDIVFNFTDQPIEAVINSVMGDLLHENYSISQGVKGSVSFSTSKPVNTQQALSILETLLSWTDNAMIRQGERYVILPASQAVAGKLVPDTAVQQPPSGLSARLFPLRYIGANEMRKLLQPFVRENAFLLVDPARNVISLAGTPQELANYQDTIDTFDVDWLKGMSIGVYGLQRASVAELMPQLQKLFGPDSGMPLADMVRFMPNDRTNSIVAISAQPEYLQEVGDWIRTIDEGGGNQPQLYVYDVRNMKAADLARYLRQIYGSGKVADDTPAKVAPGLKTTSLTSLNGTGSQSLATSGIQEQHSEAFDEPSEQDSEEPAQETTGETESASGTSLEATVRITAQKGSNQLLVRARPAQWKEIESAVKRLDTPPLQVQIETRILEVQLTGDLDLGVQWYLGRLAGNSTSDTVANERGSQGALGAGGVALGSSSLFYSFVSDNLQVALRALETRGLTQVLSAPSLVVLNNQQAQIQVGDNVPINQTTVNTSTSDTTLSSVEYVQTGVILDVVPRINPGGLVYMDIQQQVSDADDSAVTDTQPNPRISSRAVSTQVAVQSGQTVLLGGLIKQDNSSSETRVPWLSSIPGLGWLFGSNAKGRDRTELIVLITPKVVNNPEQARQVTAEYRQQMQLLKAQGVGG
ncbi:type II secretion system secretin GspD [Pseudomonas sp. S31]|uniref:type II secretion system secretin GspD n=1 Tax=Pseudomonas sp. S31 TaxID=1564473 RepID=UPI001913FD24|nr:type II secretion system secretin GspD [Pseudomonas sp. S31]